MNPAAPLSQLSAAESLTVIDRLFQKMGVMYGSKFAAMWESFAADMDGAKREWADALRPYSTLQMKRALDHMIQNNPFPPTMPEFVGLCRQFRDVGTLAKLPAPVAHDRSAEIAAKIADFLDRGHRGESRRGGKDWALKIMANPKAYPHISVQFAREALGIVEEHAA